MGSPGGYAQRLVISPPEKGSFPLDHFLECQEHVDLYKACLSSHNNESAHCHHLAKNYLQCRMDKGLMMKEDLNDLGFAKPQVPPGVILTPPTSADTGTGPGTGAGASASATGVVGAYGDNLSKPYIAGINKIRRG